MFIYIFLLVRWICVGKFFRCVDIGSIIFIDLYFVFVYIYGIVGFFLLFCVAICVVIEGVDIEVIVLIDVNKFYIFIDI